MEGLLGRESEVVEGEVWRGWSDLEVRLGWLCSALNKVQICVRGNAFHIFQIYQVSAEQRVE